jgi:hypothetical protein
MNKETKDLREKFYAVFGKEKVFTNHEGQLLVACPICEHSIYKVLVDIDNDTVKCRNCKFSADPIALFLDAYSDKPTGVYQETDNIEVIKRRIIR